MSDAACGACECGMIPGYSPTAYRDHSRESLRKIEEEAELDCRDWGDSPYPGQLRLWETWRWLALEPDWDHLVLVLARVYDCILLTCVGDAPPAVRHRTCWVRLYEVLDNSKAAVQKS